MRRLSISLCVTAVAVAACAGGAAEPRTQARETSKLEKRAGPSDVKPVTIGNVRFEAIHWGKQRGLRQNGGFIAAHDAATGRELWILKVYDVVYDPRREEDVQDVFIESMSGTASGQLEVTDEDGRVFVVTPQTRAVRRR